MRILWLVLPLLSCARGSSSEGPPAQLTTYVSAQEEDSAAGDSNQEHPDNSPGEGESDAGTAESSVPDSALQSANDKAEEEEAEEDSISAEYQSGGKGVMLRGTLSIASATIDVSVQQPKEDALAVAALTIRSPKRKPKKIRLPFPDPFGSDTVEVLVESLPSFGDPRLAMLQIFMESGEDAFSRDMTTALLFLGDDKRPAKILWQGQGSYSTYSGECDQLDVLHFEAAGNFALVKRHEELRVSPPLDGEWVSGDAKDCVVKPKKISTVARIRIPSR